MNTLAILFVLGTSVALLAVPRRWAPLSLLIGACYMTLAQSIEIGPFRFTVIRMLIAVGIIRTLMRGERPAGGITKTDWIIIAWAVWALCASGFHNYPADTLVFHLGMVYNTLGIYFLIRCFCQTVDDAVAMAKMVAILLVPVALEMVLEQVAHRNFFAVFGGVPESPPIRQGRLRSQGPFAHSILAGNVGALCVPLMLGIWRKYPMIAKVGLAACLLMVVTSASSGPLLSLMVSIFAVVLWRWRHLTRQMRIAAVVVYVLLELVMKAPAYYLIARIDLAGGSTGYHRAALIQSAVEHLNEWWLAGTDYTRHWMPYGASWNPDHADITNHYLGQGVKGGLPLMLLFILILWSAFRNVGRSLQLRSEAPLSDQFFIWLLGASLFAHAASCISVAYFDQSFVFLFSTVATITSLHASASAAVDSESLSEISDPETEAPPRDFPPPKSAVENSVA